MELFGQRLSRMDLLRRVGGLSQVGRVRILSFDEGHARGTRFVDFRTGSGFRFSVLADRGLDVGPAEYRGASLGWETTKGYAAPAEAPSDFAKTYRTCVTPQVRWSHQAGYILNRPDENGIGRVALVNRRSDIAPGGVGVFMAYDARALPSYTPNRMMAEGIYTIGMEPATNPTGSVPELLEKGYPVMLEPGESREYNLEFGLLAGQAEIDAFEARLSTVE